MVIDRVGVGPVFEEHRCNLVYSYLHRELQADENSVLDGEFPEDVHTGG